MRSISAKGVLVGAALVLAVSSVDAQVFDKGDRKMDLTFGVGVIEKTDKARATFDQHFTMEWGVAKFANQFTLGVGFAVNNSYMPGYDSRAVGKYDYSYQSRRWGKVYDRNTKRWKPFSETRMVHREGVGTADCKVSRDDIDALAIVSLHFSPMDKLDTYMRVGVGVGYMHFMLGDYSNYDGFDENNYSNSLVNKTLESHIQYSYNDVAHAEWSGGDSKVVPAIAVYVGASYQLTDRWGIDAQVGMLNANLKGKKKGFPNSYGIFAVGASYRF